MKNQENKPDATAAESTAAKSGDTKFILGITLKLLIISAVTALLLSGVNALTAARIAENNEREKQNAIAAIFPDSDSSRLSDAVAEDVNSVYLVFAGDELLGYAASVSPMGFGGELDMMVGVAADGSVSGIEIVAHSETPGLGSRVNSESYLSQYAGLGGSLALGSDVDAITGSTISSKAVLRGVNSALDAYSAVFNGNNENGGLE